MRKIVIFLIIACLVLLLGDNLQEGYADKYILKSKIVPPVCPKCPDLINTCENKQRCPPCPGCKRCPDYGVDVNDRAASYNGGFSDSVLPIPFGLKRGHSSRNDQGVNYRRMVKSQDKPIPWLNSFSGF